MTRADPLQDAQRAHRTGDLAQACTLYRRCLDATDGKTDDRIDHGRIQMLLATCEADLGNLGTAIELLRRARAALPPPAGIEALYARVLRAQARRDFASGDLAAALPLIREAAEVTPADPAVLQDLGAMELKGGGLIAARSATQASLAIRPGSLETQRNLALAARADGDHAEAIRVLEQACATAPERSDLHRDLAACYEADGRQEQAELSLEAALAADPDDLDAEIGLATLADWRGDTARARSLLARSLALRPPHPMALVLATRIAEDALADAAATDLAQALDTMPDAAWSAQGWFALGAAAERRGQYDDAWAAYRSGNAQRRPRWDRALHRASVDASIAAWDATRCTTSSGLADARPVFIVGMPRSGTSLVEQVLACHPEVQAAGERADLAQIVQGLPDHGDASALADAAQRYLDAVAGDMTRMRVTDKMPLNFLHLGAAAALLPECRIVHCRRDPLDVAVSCFATDFTDPQLAFSADLDDLGAYLSDHLRLMEHWRTVLPIKIYDLDYERLVEHPDAAIRELLDALALPWDERCLAPHVLDRRVRTTSFAQVRKPIYASSVGRHQHFERMLEPIRQALSSGTPT
jgi:tetratricopeptide (TPR) repeat protein